MHKEYINIYYVDSAFTLQHRYLSDGQPLGVTMVSHF